MRTSVRKRFLRDAGHTVELLRSHLPTNAKDPDVIACAQSLDAVLVTLNGDFADIINYPPANFRGIIALQVRNHPEALPAIVMRLLTYLAENSMPEHWIGKLFLVEAHTAFELRNNNLIKSICRSLHPSARICGSLPREILLCVASGSFKSYGY